MKLPLPNIVRFCIYFHRWIIVHPNSSIGYHAHIGDEEIIFVLEGKGKVICDGEMERVEAGLCHYCPKGHAHSLINDSKEDLIFFAVIPVHEKM